MGKSAVRRSLLLLLLVPSQALCESYTFVDVHPPGWTESRVVCINDRGEAVGYGQTAGGERGYLWSSGRITVILPPGADGARAVWINNRGDIAGTAVTGGVRRAFLLRDGEYLDPTPGWATSEAAYVGEDGEVGGRGEFGAYLSRDGATEILPGFSAVVSGNSSGTLIGNGDNTARLYLPGTGYRDLTPPGTSSAAPRGINENGRVAVTSRQSGVDKGFVFSDPFFVSMTPPGWSSSRATAINDLEEVAGFGDSPEGRISFLRAGATYSFLSFPGWTATEAAAINDLGQVAGAGTTSSGETHAFVASPPGAAPGSSPGTGVTGGCSMASRGTDGGPSGPAAADGILLGSPLLPLLGRKAGAVRVRLRARGIRSGAGDRGKKRTFSRTIPA